MGCTSSTLKYRNVYEELCLELGISPEEIQSKVSSIKAVQARSNTFAVLGQDVDPHTGTVRTVSDSQKPFLEDPKAVAITTLTNYAKETWKLATIHPLTVYLCGRAATALNVAIPEVQTADANTLRRSEFRLWMLAVCETFHVLAIFQEQKAMPKGTQKWFRKLERSSALFASNSSGARGVLPSEVKELKISADDLVPHVLDHLGKAFPEATRSPSPTAEQLLELTRTHVAQRGRHENPLQPADGSTRSILGSGSLSFFDFVEAIVIAQVLAIRGPEEDPTSYARAPDAAQENSSTEYIVESKGTLLAGSDGEHSSRRSANERFGAEPGRTQGPYKLPDLLAWATVLNRYDEIHAELLAISTQDATSPASSETLEKEKAAIDLQLRELFGLVSRDAFCLDRKQAADGLCEVFTLHNDFGAVTAEDHAMLSDLAFTQSTAGSDALTSDEQLRHYLAVYIHLYNMCSEARQVGHSDGSVAPVECLTGADVGRVLSVLPCTQQRQVALAADPLHVKLCKDEADGHDSCDEVVTFQPLLEVLAQPEANVSDSKVSFTALCEFVAHAIVRGGSSVVSLHDLSELKQTLGLDTPSSEGKNRSAEFMVHCVGATPEATAEDSSDFVSVVCRKARLDRYTCSPIAGAEMAAHFSAAACAFPLTTSVQVAGGNEDTSSANNSCATSGAATVDEWASRIAAAVRSGVATEDASFLVLSSFFAHALYVSTAALRCIGDSRNAGDADGSKSREMLDGEGYRADEITGLAGGSTEGMIGASDSTRVPMGAPLISLETRIGHKWFSEAVRQIAAVLGCQTADLLTNADRILAARPRADATISVSTAGARRPAKNVKCASSVAGSSTGEDTGKTDETAAVDRAFCALCATTPVIPGQPQNTVRVEDMVYLCLLNTAMGAFKKEPLLRAFFRAMLPSSLSDAIDAILDLLPLNDEESQYQDFFLFSGGNRTVAFDQREGGEGTTEELDQFIHKMYAHYEDPISAIVDCEATFARWFHEGVTHIRGERGEITARDYAALLEYISAQLIACAKHMGNKAANGAVITATSNVGYDPVRRKFIEELILFPQNEDTSDAVTKEGAVDTARRVFTELQLNEMETRNGDVSFDSAAAWYGTHRVAHMAPERRSGVERWRLVAGEIPFTMSVEHRHARHAIIKELRELRKQQLRAGKAGGNSAAGADGYMAAELLIARCLSMFPQGYISLVPSCADVETWLRACIRRTNEVVGRTDLGADELHERDLRFFLAFAHRDMTAFCVLQEAKKEVDAVLALQRDGKLSGAVCEDAQSTLRAALERCLREDLQAPNVCVDELLLEDCLARFFVDGQFDCEGLAHHIASTIVAHSHQLFTQAQQDRLEVIEAQVIALYENELLLGRHPPEVHLETRKFKHSSIEVEPTATYWERLRHLLPHGNSPQQRALRQQLWNRVDIREKGYATLADLNRGLHDVLRLHEFREDLAPVLFRAFFATTEMFSAESDVVYLTSSNEQFITPRQFRVFLLYLYSYMELYYMFDVLTCSGFLDEKLRISEEALDPMLGGGQRQAPATITSAASTAKTCDVTPLPAAAAPESDLAGATNADGTPTAVTGTPEPSSLSAEDVLFEASKSPYAITYVSSGVRKHVTLTQFKTAHRLLRHWGVNVQDAEAAFHDINRRARETGEMYFTGFAVWASEIGLHPEGYGYGFNEDDDEVARIEAGLSAMR